MPIRLPIGLAAGALSLIASTAFADQSRVDILAQVLSNSSTAISESNWHCEGETAHNVGAVLASIIDIQLQNPHSPLTAGCEAQGAGETAICSIGISACANSQSKTECNSRLLRYSLQGNAVQAKAFACIDIP